MNSLIPIWILGAPFIGLLVLAYSFGGTSAMGRYTSLAKHEDYSPSV